ncbi:Arm DNA-binding domain-containing protein [Lysinibacillus fusiformis]|uniref:Arm DNA-binding domain-containing protein n=1 Tax=Lysinibacillus fusiformis TaxID=28031 RepID=UPI00111321FE|nr:Arm DNA-binding domain-containing protein [Lysinibacillus fusiformis]
MVRKKLNSTKKENIYWYYDTNKKKKYAFRYKFYDHTGVRREKTRQNFSTSTEAKKA